MRATTSTAMAPPCCSPAWTARRSSAPTRRRASTSSVPASIRWRSTRCCRRWRPWARDPRAWPSSTAPTRRWMRAWIALTTGWRAAAAGADQTAATGPARGRPTLPPAPWAEGWRSLDQAQGQRIAVGDAVVGLDRSHDGQHQPGDSHDHEQRTGNDDPDPEGEDGHQEQHQEDDRHGDVEVQRFLGLVIDEGHGVLLDQPDHQRADETAEAAAPGRGQQAAEQRGQVREHRPLPLLRIDGLRRGHRLAGVAVVVFVDHDVPPPAGLPSKTLPRQSAPATVIPSIRIEPVRMCERGSTSLPTASMAMNISRRLPATVMPSTGWVMAPPSTRKPEAPRE